MYVYMYVQVIIVGWSTPGAFQKSLRLIHLVHGLLMPTCVVETMYGKNMLTFTNQLYQEKKRESIWYISAHITLVVVMETESVALLYC